MLIGQKWCPLVRLPNIKDIRRDRRSWRTDRRIDIIKYGFALGSKRFRKFPHFQIFEALFTPNIRSRKSSRTNRQIALTKYIGYSSPAIRPPGDNVFNCRVIPSTDLQKKLITSFIFFGFPKILYARNCDDTWNTNQS